MAKKPTSEPIKNLLTKPKDVFKAELEERIDIGNSFFERAINTKDDVNKLKTDYIDWSDFNGELIKYAFNNPDNEHFYKYDNLNKMVGLAGAMRRNVNTRHPKYQLDITHEKINNCIRNLKRLITKLPVLPSVEKIEKFSTKDREFTNKGFIVHGHNDALKLEVARFLEKQLGKDATILHEMPSKGKTVIEKFETYSTVDFAIALWTNDDLGKAKKEEDLKPRARQNVIFETGFFLGKIGRNNVIILHENGIEIPSDYSGVVYVALEGNWKESLRIEIEEIYNG